MPAAAAIQAEASAAPEMEMAETLRSPSDQLEPPKEGEEERPGVAEVQAQVPIQLVKMPQHQQRLESETVDQTRYQVGSLSSAAGRTESLAMSERAQAVELVLPRQGHRASRLVLGTVRARPGETPAAGSAVVAIPELQQG